MVQQHEDVWSRTRTANGHRADEVRSVLQKSIRRGRVEDAILAGYELYLSGPESEDMLWRRLEIIAVEDVGLGMPDAPQLIEAAHAQRLRCLDDLDRFMFAAHVIRALCEAKKDRTAMELAVWARASVERGERQVEVKDFHVDHHTTRGVALGRGPEFWWAAGGYGLENMLDPDGSPWSGYVREVLGAPPTGDVPSPDYTKPAPAEGEDAR
jgi:replication-associated recombination protein RarA